MYKKAAYSKREKSLITSGLFSSRTDEWATPQQFFDTLDAEFDFDLDVAATKKNTKCRHYFSKRENGLKQDWYKASRTKTIFCNPPFGGQTGLWVEKALHESQKGCTVVVVIPFRSDTSYLHDFAFNKASEIRLVRGRIKYNDGNTASPFPTAVIVFTPGYHTTKWTTINKEAGELSGLGEIGEVIKLKPDITYNTSRLYRNGKKAPDGIELRFGQTRPTAEVRELLKKHGFQFSEKQKIWYAIDNAKSRELVDFLSNNEIDADDTQYEKKHFWAKVSSYEQYTKLSNFTEFMVKSDPPRNFYRKSALEKAYGSVRPLITDDLLRFKKFYNVVVGEDREETEDNEAKEENNEEENKKGQEEPKPRQAPSSVNVSLADKLKDLADGMQKQINEKINSAISHQRPTARRIRIAAGMREDGYRLQHIQNSLYALSAAHRDGSIRDYSLLKEIRNKAQVELFNRFADAYGKKEGDRYLQDAFDHNKDSFKKMGINTASDWSLAYGQKEDLLQKYDSAAKRQRNETEEKIRKLEQEVWGRKIPGFFPTPPELIERLIKLSGIRQGDKVLEPSAGKGDILDALRKHYGDSIALSACEINSGLWEILKLKNYTLIEHDFFEVEEPFDCIVMNPPFENGQDIDHVLHAASLLKPRGRVVAIMGEGFTYRNFKADKGFRDMLKKMNAYISEPIQGAFKNAYNSTGVNVRIVAINQDGSPIQPGERGQQYIQANTSSNPQGGENTPEAETDNETTDEEKLLELEAKAKLELIKYRIKLAKQRKGLNGLSGMERQKICYIKQRMNDINGIADVWNLK